MLPVKKWPEKPILKDAGSWPNHSKIGYRFCRYAMDQCHLGCFNGWSVILYRYLGTGTVQPGRVGALRMCTNFIIIIIITGLVVTSCAVQLPLSFSQHLVWLPSEPPFHHAILVSLAHRLLISSILVTVVFFGRMFSRPLLLASFAHCFGNVDDWSCC